MLNGGSTISSKNGKKHMPEYLFDYSNKIFKTIERADNTLLFLDYDGTLVSFKDKPDEVVTSKEVETVLEKLVQNPKFTVFIISGRTLNEIKSLLAIEGLSFAALHGLQIELSNGKSFSWSLAENVLPFLEKIKEKVFYEFKDEKGVFIEDKGFTLAFHYRMLSKEKIEGAVEKFIDTVKNIDKKNMLEIIHGAKVVEARPRGWDKGKATELILNNIQGNTNTIPVYIGDDTTDEDAFKYLKNQGLTIFVTNNSNRTTSAHYWLKNPDEVLMFLKNLP